MHSHSYTCLQEASVTAQLKERGTLHFEFEGDPVWLEVHVFSAGAWQGEPKESDEVRGQMQ